MCGVRGIVSPSRGVVAPTGWVRPTPSLPPGGLSGRPTLRAAQRRRRRYSSENFACKATCANLPQASTDFREQSPLQAHTSRAEARPPPNCKNWNSKNHTPCCYVQLRATHACKSAWRGGRRRRRRLSVMETKSPVLTWRDEAWLQRCTTRRHQPAPLLAHGGR